MNTHFDLCVHMCTHNSYTIIIFLYWIHPLQPWNNFTLGISRCYICPKSIFTTKFTTCILWRQIFHLKYLFFSKNARCYVWFLYVLCGCKLKWNIGYENHHYSSCVVLGWMFMWVHDFSITCITNLPPPCKCVFITLWQHVQS